MQRRYIRKMNFETVRLDEDWIVIDTERLMVTRLNDVGWRCWTLLGHPQTVDSLVQALRRDYEEVGEAAESDIELFLGELSQCGLLEHVGA